MTHGKYTTKMKLLGIALSDISRYLFKDLCPAEITRCVSGEMSPTFVTSQMILSYISPNEDRLRKSAQHCNNTNTHCAFDIPRKDSFRLAF